jgi:hypothetical protein
MNHGDLRFAESISFVSAPKSILPHRNEYVESMGQVYVGLR